MTWGVTGATVSFGANVALDHVDIALEPGRIAVVVGGDGAGKTTLCRAIVGLEGIDTGAVARPPRTCFQPETSGVWADLTVLENLEFVAGSYGLESSHARARIDELLDVTDLGVAKDRLGRQLSGGMRQKLGVSMAVLSEPELLVLDEPTTGLDPVSRLELWSFIGLSARQDRAVLVSTSYIEEARRGDSVLALEEGRTLASGTVDDVIATMPGRLFEAREPFGANSWRRGRGWLVWSPDGSQIPGGTATTPDLADVITVAALSGGSR